MIKVGEFECQARIKDLVFGIFHCLWNGKEGDDRLEIFHREDGPACEFINGKKEWWYMGKQIKCSSQAEFSRILKLKAFW